MAFVDVPVGQRHVAAGAELDGQRAADYVDVGNGAAVAVIDVQAGVVP